jgi:uncharacterized membrane protein
MKEQREMQTHIDELNAHIRLQGAEIESLHKLLDSTISLAPSIAKDALRYRWLRKYSGQMFMATEQQVDAEVDRAMSGGVK